MTQCHPKVINVGFAGAVINSTNKEDMKTSWVGPEWVEQQLMFNQYHIMPVSISV